MGAGSPPSPAGTEGLAGGSRGLRACVGGWGAVPAKLGGSAGRLSGFAGWAVGGGRRGGGRCGVPRDGPGGAGATWEQPKQCVLTGVPRKQWPGPSTRAGRRARLQGPREGLGVAADPKAHPSKPPAPPKIRPRESCLLPIPELAVHGLRFLDVCDKVYSPPPLILKIF